MSEAVAFQPFGYRFEVQSPMPLENVKAAIRARKKSWFDPKDGPRGWIVGPFICLWMSAFDRYGPMLFGWITRDRSGTRIAGRAGSDLNGLLLYLLLLPLLGFFLWLMIASNEASTNQIAIIGGLILLSPLMLWWTHKDRKHAEPLVRFIRNTVTASGQSLRAKSASKTISPRIRMTVSGEERSDIVTAESVHDALLHAGVGDSVILAVEPEAYIQTLLQEDGFIIEKREGSAARHYKAIASAKTLDPGGHSLFTFEETLAALIAYGSGTEQPSYFVWERMELPE